MTKQSLLDFSADNIGKPWTVESHQRLVVGLHAVEKLAQDVIALRDREHAAALARYRHSPVDPEAAEI